MLYDIRDVRRAHLVSLRKFPNRLQFGREECSDFANISFGEASSAAMRHASWVAPTALAISHIFRLRARYKVIRIHAARRITHVPQDLSLRNWAY